MIKIDRLTDSLYEITSTRYSAALHKQAKATPGLSWSPQRRAWVGYVDAIAVCVGRLDADGIIVNGTVPEPLVATRDGRTTIKQGLVKDLRRYQREGVQFLYDHAKSGALLADDMGLGKTAQTLRAIGALERSALIVVPSFVRNVWQRETKKWLAKWPVVNLLGTKPKPQDLEELRVNAPTVFLVHYDIVHAWVEPIINNGAMPPIIVFDEAHYLMSEKSRRSLACRELARKAMYKIGLSGTPMTSRPKDMWNVVDTLSEGRFGKPFAFFLVHCDAHKETVTTRQGDKVVWNIRGASNLGELKHRLDYFMLRRTKTDVALELPPRTRQVVEVEIERRLCLPVGAALKTDGAMREALAIAADGKINKAIELILDHVENGSKVVVFSHRKVIAETIANALRGSGVDTRIITGEVEQKKRVEIVDAQPAVLCATLDSTSVGIDLSYADTAVFVELDYVPSKLAQAEARLHRFGQQRNVLIQYIIALSTVDEVIADTVVNKLDVFEQAVGKMDDGLRQSLGGTEVSNIDQLRSLYEKIKNQEVQA